jgi:hypothetical protein
MWYGRRIHDSMTLIFRLAGKARRTPHEYRAIDRLTYEAKQRLLNTHECVHASVRIRMGLKGYGYNDEGFYDSQGLQGWTMEWTESSPSSTTSSITATGKRVELTSMTDVKWVKKDPQERNDPDLVMPEDALGHLEREIMKSWPDVEKGFAVIRPGAHPLKVHKASTDPLEPSPRHSHISGNADSGSGQEDAKKQGVEFGAAKKTPTV